ncbi:hypothetical protein NLU13_1721 [Sarocladium strictum]|uniref:Uncharacterized protein n=1 Tax=Sarocladium strictum TaxID=5046 RepID=A0AA39LCS5_SARSR|nr:hypothetical protein NLU13_1721 [Sarocladium strictum]
MPARQDSYSNIAVPNSPPPPQDLSSYARFMHDHTKRQMEASGAVAPRSGGRAAGPTHAMTNGTSPTEYS